MPELTRFADVVDAANYRQAPADWHLLLTDVRGSTRAWCRSMSMRGTFGAFSNAPVRVAGDYVFAGATASVGQALAMRG